MMTVRTTRASLLVLFLSSGRTAAITGAEYLIDKGMMKAT